MGKQSRFDLPIGNVPGQGGASAGGWRQNGRKAECVNQGDLSTRGAGVGFQRPRVRWAGVRAPLVARKWPNGHGAKGAPEGGWEVGSSTETTPAPVPSGLRKPEPCWPRRRAITAEPTPYHGDDPLGMPGSRRCLGWASAISPHCSGSDRSLLSEVNHRLESRMREIRLSGLEGGGTDNRFSLSLSKGASRILFARPNVFKANCA